MNFCLPRGGELTLKYVHTLCIRHFRRRRRDLFHFLIATSYGQIHC